MLNELMGLDNQGMEIDDYEASLLEKINELEDNLMECEMLLQ